MTDADFLLAIAEVGATFAGFAGLVTILARRVGKAPTSEAEVHLLYRMLLVSMLAVAAALVPRLPLRFGANELEAWRVSCGVFFAGWLLYYVPTVRRIIAVIDPSALIGGRALLYSNQLVHVVVGAGLATGAAGLWGDTTPAIYLLALCAMLYMAGVLFVTLFMLLARGWKAAAQTRRCSGTATAWSN